MPEGQGGNNQLQEWFDRLFPGDESSPNEQAIGEQETENLERNLREWWEGVDLESAQADKPIDPLTGEPEKIKTLQEKISGDPRFQELMDLSRNYQMAYISPHVGSTAEIRGAAKEKAQELKREYGVSGRFLEEMVAKGGLAFPAPFTDIAERDPGRPPLGPGVLEQMLSGAGAVGQFLDVPQRVGTDVQRAILGVPTMMGQALRRLERPLDATAGLLEPLLLFGDVPRHFSARLMQSIQDPDAPEWMDRLPGSTLWGAAHAARAGAATINELFVKDGNWVSYLPSIRWGDWGYGRNPYQNENLVSGREWAETMGIFERYGIEDEGVKDNLGIAFEVLVDPLTALTGGYALLRIASLSGRLAKSKRVVDSAERGRMLLREVEASMGPFGITRAAREEFKLVDNFFGWVQRGINRFLDQDIPFLTWGTQEATAHQFGMQEFAKGRIPVRVRDVFFQRGATPFDSPDSYMRLFTGHEDVAVSLAQQAHGKQNQIQRIAFYGVRDLGEILMRPFAKPVNLRIGGNFKMLLPGARIVPKEKHGFINIMGENVTRFVDETGFSNTAQALRDYEPRINRAARAYGVDPVEANRIFREAVQSARKTTLLIGYHLSGYEDYARAMRIAAHNTGTDYSDMRAILEDRAAGLDLRHFWETRQAEGGPVMRRPRLPPDQIQPPSPAPRTQPGEVFARPRYVVDVAEEAQQVVIDPERIELFRRRMNLSPEEVQRHLDELENLERAMMREGWTVVTDERGHRVYTRPPDQPMPRDVESAIPTAFDDFERFYSEFQSVLLREQNPFVHITPETYLRGVRDGYMRRIFEGIDSPEKIINKIHARETITVREAELSRVAPRFEELYDERTARAVSDYIEGRPNTGVFRVDELTEVIRRQTGRNISEDDVARILLEGDPQLDFMNETLAMIGTRALSQPGVAGGATMARRPVLFGQRKELTPDELTALVENLSPWASIADLGVDAGRAVRSQFFLNRSFEHLNEMGMIMSRSEIERNISNPHIVRNVKQTFEGIHPQTGQVDPNRPLYAFMDEGTKYVAIPKNNRAWGPFAGHVIPEEAARQLFRSSLYQDRTIMERVLSMWRQALISPLPTAIRNVVGNIITINQAGGDFFGIMSRMPAAHRARQEFHTKGWAKELDDSEYMMPFLSDATLSSHLRRSLDEQLSSIAGHRDVPAVLDYLERTVDAITHQPMVGGFLGLFRWGEETTRIATYMWARDELLARGVARSQAIARAAHFATNAAYDYGSLPKGPDILRRTGLSSFPQFSYYSIGRTFQALAKRPSVLHRQETARHLANTYFIQDTDERDRVNVMMAQWLRHTNPLAFPVFDQRAGLYYVANLDFWTPQGAVGGAIFEDPWVGGVYLPLLEFGTAMMGREGEAFYTRRFGQDVYDPASPLFDRVTHGLLFLAESYILPGQARTARQLYQSWEYSRNKEAMDTWGMMSGRHLNYDWAQFFLRQVGITTQKVGVADPQTLRMRLRDVDRRYDAARRSLQNQRRELLAHLTAYQREGKTEQARKAIAQIQQLNDRVIQLSFKEALEKRRIREAVRAPTQMLPEEGGQWPAPALEQEAP